MLVEAFLFFFSRWHYSTNIPLSVFASLHCLSSTTSARHLLVGGASGVTDVPAVGVTADSAVADVGTRMVGTSAAPRAVCVPGTAIAF